jgi:hypothetical protein
MEDIINTQNGLSLKTTLGVLDTIHDFFKERGKTASEDGEEVDDTKIEFIRNAMVQLISEKFPGFAGIADIGPIVQRLTLTAPGASFLTNASSKFEPGVVAFFEKTYPIELNANSKLQMSYEEILGLGAGNALLTGGALTAHIDAKITELDTLRGITDILIIKPGRKSYHDLTQEHINSFARFILCYYFPREDNHLTYDANPRVTFDGKTGIVGKLFRDIPEVFNIMSPATISDSAPTSFSILNGRSEYLFPGGAGFTAESNIYTTGDFTISYVNKGFTNKNPFGFVIRIQHRTGPSVDIPFDNGAKEGPSVNYLISLMQQAVAGANLSGAEKKKAVILRIGDYIRKNPALLEQFMVQINALGVSLDFKRTGDWEQAHALFVILTTIYKNSLFVTIDHLSCLRARMKRINSLFHYAENMTLYRFLTGAAPDPRIAAIRTRCNQAKQELALINKIDRLFPEGRSNIPGQLRDYSGRLNTYLSAVYPDAGAEDSPSRLAWKITTKLLRLRVYDMMQSITLPAEDLQLTPARYAEIKAYEAPLAAFIAAVEANINTIEDAAVPAQLPNITANYNAELAALAAFDVTETKLEGATVIEINKDLTKAVAGGSLQFLPRCSHTFFKYNAAPFTAFYNAVKSIDELGRKITSGRRVSVDVFSLLNKTEYFKSVDLIASQFANEGVAERVRTALDIDVSVPAGADMNAELIRRVGLINGAVNAIYGTVPQLTELPAPPIGGNAVLVGGSREFTQVGGAYPGQAYDLSDLLRKECTAATTFIEQEYYRFYPNLVAKKAIEAPIISTNQLISLSALCHELSIQTDTRLKMDIVMTDPLVPQVISLFQHAILYVSPIVVNEINSSICDTTQALSLFNIIFKLLKVGTISASSTDGSTKERHMASVIATTAYAENPEFRHSIESCSSLQDLYTLFASLLGEGYSIPGTPFYAATPFYVAMQDALANLGALIDEIDAIADADRGTRISATMGLINTAISLSDAVFLKGSDLRTIDLYLFAELLSYNTDIMSQMKAILLDIEVGFQEIKAVENYHVTRGEQILRFFLSFYTTPERTPDQFLYFDETIYGHRAERDFNDIGNYVLRFMPFNSIEIKQLFALHFLNFAFVNTTASAFIEVAVPIYAETFPKENFDALGTWDRVITYLSHILQVLTRELTAAEEATSSSSGGGGGGNSSSSSSGGGASAASAANTIDASNAFYYLREFYNTLPLGPEEKEKKYNAAVTMFQKPEWQKIAPRRWFTEMLAKPYPAEITAFLSSKGLMGGSRRLRKSRKRRDKIRHHSTRRRTGASRKRGGSRKNR